MLVVSHDLKELSPLVDYAWEMRMGGCMHPVPWPPLPDALAGVGSEAAPVL